jgi:gliding motility-associated-like protein
MLLDKKYFYFIILWFAFHLSMQAQLGFCEGNSGDPIFEEDFGQGTQNGPQLPQDVTEYTYVNQGPEDGQYTISSNLFQLQGFHDTTDHTGNQNGKALIVNADLNPGLFYQIPIGGLCINNSYEFSAYLINIYNTNVNFCPNNGIPVNVKFQIWDESDTTLLAEGNTGEINGTTSPIWEQFALTFTTLPGQDSVILKMLNKGQGGCGNDLAIDDIVFKSCGDLTEIISENSETQLQVCENVTVEDLTLTAEPDPDLIIYDSPNYQWQESNDGENWNNISGETKNQIVIPQITGDRFYRTLVADDPTNVNTTKCNSISTVFEIEFIDFIDPVSLGDVFVCEGDSQIIAVETNSNITVNWYDSEENGTLLVEDTFGFEPETNRVYYAEATTINGNCTNPKRIAIEYLQYTTPELTDETLRVCRGESLILFENIQVAAYLWSTGETSNSIEVENSGEYSLELTTANNCVISKTFTVETFTLPVISNIIQKKNSLVVEMASEGDFRFSVDGRNYQNQSAFNDLSGGLYTIYVRENNGCGIVTEDFLYFNIPKFFTPNGDQINDTFKINDDIYFDNFEIVIFDRYGKVLARGSQAPFNWNGTYNSKKMPSDDYWYRIKVNDEIYTGHITLKR